jgi:hypothetical protein
LRRGLVNRLFVVDARREQSLERNRASRFEMRLRVYGFIPAVFCNLLLPLMRSPAARQGPTIRLPLDQGWSFLSVLSQRGFAAAFFLH